MAKSSYNIVVGIIFDAEKQSILVSRRNTADIKNGEWEFPGGKLEFGETRRQALARELYEEVGIKVLEAKKYSNFDYCYPKFNVSLNFYIVKKHVGVAFGREGQIVRWVTINQLPDLNMLKANETIVADLVKDANSAKKTQN